MHAQNTPETPCRALQGTQILVLFAENAPLERLALALSLREMGSSELYFGKGEWTFAPEEFTYGELAVACAVGGLDLASLEQLGALCPCPLFNCGGPDANPARLLADMALMRQTRPDLSNTRIAWLGGASGLAHSLIEAAMYVPFELFMALPEWGEPNRELLALAFSAGAKIFLTREAHMAVDGAHFVYAGSTQDAAATGRKPDAITAGMLVDSSIMSMAAPEARLMAGQEGRLCVEPDLWSIHAAFARERLAMRLRVQRWLWNWLLAE